ncbi:MAG: hypothetical protein KQI81_23070 [Deltaproteobacteria bacterium]|nr:hypothetical protein [Deltaproteobacteria bacterium]
MLKQQHHPCILDNGFLQILDWEKFALTVYDRERLDDFWVWLRPDDGLSGYSLRQGPTCMTCQTHSY